MHTLLWAVQLYTTVLIRCTSPAFNRDSFNRTGPSFPTQCSCSPLYSWPIQHVCQNTLRGIVEPETTNRLFLPPKNVSQTLLMVNTLSDFPYSSISTTEPHTLFEQISTVSQALPETSKTEKPTNQTNPGNPTIFQSLFISLSISFSFLTIDLNTQHYRAIRLWSWWTFGMPILACAVMIGMERRRYWMNDS